MALSLSNGVPKFLHYKPRDTLYKVFFTCKIKDQHTDSWVDGLCYQLASGNGEVYTRPLTAFSDNFDVYYS